MYNPEYVIKLENDLEFWKGRYSTLKRRYRELKNKLEK